MKKKNKDFRKWRKSMMRIGSNKRKKISNKSRLRLRKLRIRHTILTVLSTIARTLLLKRRCHLRDQRAPTLALKLTVSTPAMISSSPKRSKSLLKKLNPSSLNLCQNK